MNYYQPKYIAYKHKYTKYKHKYTKLKKLIGGTETDIETVTNKNMIDANNEFTIDLFDNLDGASNIFSPLAISFALSLIQLGTIGLAKSQLLELVGHNYDANELITLKKSFNNQVMKVINVIVYDEKINIKLQYQQIIQKLAKITEYNDNAIHKINNQVEYATDGMIKDFFPNGHNSVSVGSAAYFKASWQHEFDVNNTFKTNFHRTEGTLVDLMHQINNFKYYENSLVQLVELPYDEKDYVMGIILPIKYLDATNLEYSINNVPQFSRQEINELINNTEYTLVDLYLPKFVQRKKINMIPLLKKMGLNKIFDINNSNYDIGNTNSYISDFVHEVLIIVDELGTKAKIINNQIVRSNEKMVIFRADHAFIYYVRHIPSGMFLFYGDYQGKKD
jgi:serpin B/serpin B11/12